MADDLPVAEVDEQADVVPRRPDAHAGQVAAYMGARRPAAEAARDELKKDYGFCCLAGGVRALT